MAAKKPPDESRHECVYIKIEQAERQVIPAIQLEQREIKMTYLPSEQSVPSIITTSSEQSTNKDADRIVGEERPLGVESFATYPMEQNGHHEQIIEASSSRHVEHQPTMSPQHHDVSAVENVLEYFEEQGKQFQEKSGSLPRLKVKKPRSASPSPIRQSVGLDHLDHLVKLMEQMSNLREENVKLKKKCDYLESTKTLLQVKSELNSELGYNSLPSKSKSKSKRQQRPRLPSAELDIDVETSSETGSSVNQTVKLHQRSYSTGSLTEAFDKSKTETKIPSGDSKTVRKSISAKIKKIASKFPEYKSKKELRGSHHRHLREGSVRTVTQQELTVPAHSGVLESRSVDSGVGSGVEVDGGEIQRKSTSSGESPSAYSSQQGVPSGEMGKDDDGIWMGPPEWQEQHKEEMQIGSLSENREVIVLKSSKTESDENHLQVPFPRRKSSPSLIDHDDKPMDLDGEEYLRLRRSSSYKGRSSHGEVFQELPEMPPSPKVGKKIHKNPWEKFKIKVSTRKDSVKKRMSRKSGHSSKADSAEELSLIDIDKYDYKIYDEHLEGPISRSTPKTSPMTIRQHREKSMSDSPPGYKETPMSPAQVTQMGGVEALMGAMSDPDFSKKLRKWEELQNAKRLSALVKDSSDEAVFSDSMGTTSPEIPKKTEDKDRSKSVKSVSSQDTKDVMQEVSREGSPDGIATPPENTSQLAKLEELLNLKHTESFTRRMEEWEKLRYMRKSTKEGSPPLGRKDSALKSGIRKDERQKSRKSKEEKDKEKLERLRKSELQRVEREQLKLEKDRIKLEMERLKALNREAKIEKMKGRLSQPGLDGKLKNPVSSPLGDYKVTTDFARRLHEWELIKGSGSSQHATYLDSHQRSLEQSFQTDSSLKKESFDEGVSTEGPAIFKVKGQRPPPLTLQPCPDSPEEVSPVCRSSDASSIEGTEDDEDDMTSVTTEGLTESNINSLEKANIKLLEELQKKEMEYASLQEEVRDINLKLEKVREQHSKDLERYNQDVNSGQPGMANLPSPSSVTTLTELQDKISELKDFGEDLAVSMESAAVCILSIFYIYQYLDFLYCKRTLFSGNHISALFTLEQFH
ncbi:hypothetical protein KUTeg_015956 [Tegillarca granosa]|uniref:Uncharacterized protein n=1 Tax=Tegillarca granosa TaxID=220873 RepID=A0ABQ9END7_TEGGR|nr:hypothetical protein KUTeg_015956 [Tegillarca granosa]